jgi:hypothetical protein
MGKNDVFYKLVRVIIVKAQLFALLLAELHSLLYYDAQNNGCQ